MEDDPLMRRLAPQALAAAVAVVALLTFAASAAAATGSMTISGNGTAGFTANVSVTTTSSDCYLGTDCESSVEITLEPTTVGCATDMDTEAIVGDGDLETSSGTDVQAISLDTYDAPSDFDLCMYWFGPTGAEPLLAQATYTAPVPTATTTTRTTTTTTPAPTPKPKPKPKPKPRPKPKLAPVVRYHAGLPLVASVTGSGVVLTINPPAGGCKRLKPGTVKLTVGTAGGTVAATPCHKFPQQRQPVADVTILNTSQFDIAAGGIELRLSSVVGRSYSDTYPLRVSYGTKTLLTGTLHTEGRWSPPQTIWQGTDAFINVCIDQGYTTYSSNLRLYCTVPGTETGNVWITKR